MANLKSSKKDIRRTLKRTVANKAQKSKIRTLLKKAKVAVLEANTKDEALKALVEYESNAMRKRSKKLFSKKSSSRRVSILRKKINEKFQENEKIA